MSTDIAGEELPAALLAAAGISAPAEEIAEISRFYAALRDQVEGLYLVGTDHDGPPPSQLRPAGAPSLTTGPADD